MPDPQEAASPEHLLASEAGQLFVHRAQAIKPDFSLDPATARTVTESWARMEGLPLAVFAEDGEGEACVDQVEAKDDNLREGAQLSSQ